MTLTELLRALDRAELLITVKGAHLAVSPKIRLTPDLQSEILRHRAELLNLFSDPPTWPPACGRSGLLRASPVVGDAVRLSDGRRGTLCAFLYDTRSGRVRYDVESAAGKRELLDPEDLSPELPLPAWISARVGW